MRLARFGRRFGSARHGNADPPPAGTQACTVSTWSGAVCVRGFMFYGVCCLFQIGAGLPSVSMLPLVNTCSRRRRAPTVFKCVWHVLDATLDQPGTAMQTRPRPGAQACTVSTRSGAVCVRVFVFFWSVLPASDWCRAAQSQQAALSEHL